MKQRFSYTRLSIAGFVCLTGVAAAATIVWNGEATSGNPPAPDPNWSSSGNWIGAAVPGSSDDVVVSDRTPQSTSVVDSAGPGQIASLALGSNMTLTVNKHMIVGTDFVVSGSCVVNGTHRLEAGFIRIGGGTTAASLTYSGSDGILIDPS